LDVDYGWAKTDWVYCERPGGQGLPSFPSAYDWNEHGLSFFSILRQGVLDEDREDTRVLDGSFNVSAGVAPRIYLGVSVFLWAERGVINSHTMGGTDQSYFVFPWGVFYAMVPD
jgi:hypothetical protein